MNSLAVHDFVAGVDLLVPGFRRVVVEDRHPAFGELEVVEIADKLRWNSAISAGMSSKPSGLSQNGVR